MLQTYSQSPSAILSQVTFIPELAGVAHLNHQQVKHMRRETLSRILIAFIIMISLLLQAVPAVPAAARSLAQTTSCEEVTIHYRRRNAEYTDWGLHVWGPTTETVTWESPLQPAGQDDYGIYWTVKMQADATLLNYIVHKGDEKDPGPDQSMTFSTTGCEIWLTQGKPDQFPDAASALATMEVTLTPAPALGDDQVLIHYSRVNQDYEGWGLHVWGPTAETGVTWTEPLMPAGQDEYGLYWIINMEPGADLLNYIVHKGDEKDPGPDQSLDLVNTGREIWLIQGSGEQFLSTDAAKEALLVAALGDIKDKAQAHWLSRDTIAWPDVNFTGASYALYYDPDGAVRITQSGMAGGQKISLEVIGNGLSPDFSRKFPHLISSLVLKLPQDQLAQVPEILKGQYALVAEAADGTVLGATALQIPGVLDDLYANDQELGIIFDGDIPTLRVWAPTARSVSLHLFADSSPATLATVSPMNLDPTTGIWEITGEPSWTGQYYLYEVEVYIRQAGSVISNLVTDPYSISLSMNSTRSQIVDLSDPSLAPSGWDTLQKPALAAPEDIVLYELHVRDFSAFDEAIPAEQRGTYLAFTNPEASGVKHLNRLAKAGLTHVHLLPVFDIATINEDKSTWPEIDYEALAALAPDHRGQQLAIQEVRGSDGFNWGYDPFHYTTPEGSYSTNPDGTTRILEFRQMVQSLNQMGLRVVMDVVYNHTNAAGQSENSVLDRVVPGYYHRLDKNGNVTNSTCCSNTATEHSMMEKLMIDSVLTWIRAYQIDGFRFDLMGHHMLSNMQALRAAVDSLTLETDGIDGKSIYLYGEGWNFGEVADNARGVNATQLNLAGSGIGSFNDRIRDAVRGGNPFGGLLEQGFITGLLTDYNDLRFMSEESQRESLLHFTDQIKVGLTGNLADYMLVNAQGELVSGAEIDYNGSPTGYTSDPQEVINYISAHDNETLFDAIQYKAPRDASMEERVRMQNLGLSLVALGQGIPFFHAGDELLRSKSFDRDSYDSGDWFNRLDYTYQTNNYGVGLPPADKNSANWQLMRQLLRLPDLVPAREHILAARDHFEEILAIRKSSPLFRLQSAQQVMERLVFHNTGPDQIPGLIVMSLSDFTEENLDPNYDLIIVLFNADVDTVEFTLAELQDASLSLHPLQASSLDSIVTTSSFNAETKSFSVPGRTTAVFVGNGTLAAAPEELPQMEPTATPAMTAQETPAAPTQAPQTPDEEPDSQPLLPWIIALGGAGALALGVWLFRRKSA